MIHAVAILTVFFIFVLGYIGIPMAGYESFIVVA
jgi:hypothetical protein